MSIWAIVGWLVSIPFLLFEDATTLARCPFSRERDDKFNLLTLSLTYLKNDELFYWVERDPKVKISKGNMLKRGAGVKYRINHGAWIYNFAFVQPQKKMFTRLQTNRWLQNAI